ncbi:hypothetical protein VNO77_30468 [Canavalia gladiata]|uniref:Protein arginine N-methyltransferase n=1 Tax=Canavalia gladiata TaxID=3824 RepID=A0AAN9KPH2_CANGL
MVDYRWRVLHRVLGGDGFRVVFENQKESAKPLRPWPKSPMGPTQMTSPVVCRPSLRSLYLKTFQPSQVLFVKMPLEVTEGYINTSCFIGIETEFDYQMSRVIDLNIFDGDFDFVVAPLISPDFRPSSIPDVHFGMFEQPEPFVETDMSMTAAWWKNRVAGKISTWIDLDSEDETLKMDSEIVLKKEINLAAYLSLRHNRWEHLNLLRYIWETDVMRVHTISRDTGHLNLIIQLLYGILTLLLAFFQLLRELPALTMLDVLTKSYIAYRRRPACRCLSKFWLRIPLGETDDDTVVDYWKTWNSFRLLCEHYNHLSVVLDNLVIHPSENLLSRWNGEPVAAFILHTDSFLSNSSGFLKYLPMDVQELITDFFKHSIQIIISAEPVPTNIFVEDHYNTHFHEVSKRHPLLPYRDYIALLYQRMDPLTEQERVEYCIRDVVQKPPEPLQRNLDAFANLKIEKDTTKYKLAQKYKTALCQALLDRVPDEKVSEITTVLAVAGPGSGSLVKTSVLAAKETGRKLKVYAVEKNPNAINALNLSFLKVNGSCYFPIVSEKLTYSFWNKGISFMIKASTLLLEQGLILTEDMDDIVTIVPSDLQCWNAPETVDILVVSEMLGSFGDNGLSPEYLDGVHRFLKEDGISIPSSYTSFLQPITASMLYNSVKAEEDILQYESAFVGKLHNVGQLAPSQPLFTFTHPKHCHEQSYQRHKKLLFVIPDDIESAMVHEMIGRCPLPVHIAIITLEIVVFGMVVKRGRFAGYFDATLYKDVHIGTEPSTATPEVFTWRPMFFPLRTPLCMHRGSILEVHFWRCCDSAKVWYEWCVTSPSLSPIYNSNGCGFRLEL